MKKLLRHRLREKRKKRVKLRVQKETSRLRLSVFRSSKHIYAQIVDDQQRKTLVAESSMTPAFKEKMNNGGNLKAAALVGSLLGEKAQKQGIEKIYYDRNGFVYAGRIKALADAVRKKGIVF